MREHALLHEAMFAAPLQLMPPFREAVTVAAVTVHQSQVIAIKPACDAIDAINEPAAVRKKMMY